MFVLKHFVMVKGGVRGHETFGCVETKPFAYEKEMKLLPPRSKKSAICQRRRACSYCTKVYVRNLYVIQVHAHGSDKILNRRRTW